MLGFNYDSFKEALRVAEQKKHDEVRQDTQKVKAFVEKMLTLMFENTANMARTEYQGIEL